MKRHYIAHIVIIFLIAIILFPIFWVVSTSFRRDQAAFSPRIVSSRLTLQHYKDLIFPEANFPAVVLKLQNIVSLSKPYDEMPKERVISILEGELSKLRRYLDTSEDLLSKSEDAYNAILKDLEKEEDRLKSDAIARLNAMKKRIEGLADRVPKDPKMGRLALYTFLRDQRFNPRSHSFGYLLELLADLDETFKARFEAYRDGKISTNELRSAFEDTLSELSKEYSEYAGVSPKELDELKDEISSLKNELSSIAGKKDDLARRMLTYEEIATVTYIPALRDLNDVLKNAEALLVKAEKSENVKNVFVDEEKTRSILESALNISRGISEKLPPVDSFDITRDLLNGLIERLEDLTSRMDNLSGNAVRSAAFVDFVKIVENSEALLINTLSEMDGFAEGVSKTVSELVRLQNRYAELSKQLERLTAEYETAKKRLEESLNSLALYRYKTAAMITGNELEYRIEKIEGLGSITGRNLSRYELYLRKARDSVNGFLSSFSVPDEDKNTLKKNLNAFKWVSDFKTFVDKFENVKKRLPPLLEEAKRLTADFESNYKNLIETRFSGVFVSSAVLDRLYDLAKFDYANRVSGSLGTVVRYAGDLIYEFPVESSRQRFKQIEGWLYKLGESWKQKPKHHFLRWVLNSVIVSGTVAIVTTIVCAIAAYPFSRMRFFGRRYGILSLLIIQMFPGVMYMVALYGLLNLLGKFVPWLGLDSLGGLIFVYLGNIAFNMYLIKGFYDTIPDSMEEAAMIDGATRFQTFYKIVIPLASPILAVIVILTFMGTFNEFVLARIILQDTAKYTYAVGLWTFAVGPYETEWGIFTAAALVGMVPMLALFLSLQRFLISGLTRGAVKG